MISAKIIADSVSVYTGKRLTTFEIVAHRFILAEINTHKMLSKNSASSRAIPIISAIEEIIKNTAYPLEWRKNQSGMVAAELLDDITINKAKAIWTETRDFVTNKVQELSDLGLHKQWANRLQENFSYQKIIITGTEWDNWFWLRICPTAQPEINKLSSLMLQEYNKSVPKILKNGEWHTPYVSSARDVNDVLRYYTNGIEVDLETALKVSASCCAQVSYRKLDDSLEKAEKVFDMLNLGSTDEDAKSHSSPVEHSGTPIKSGLFKNNKHFSGTWEDGITHVNKNGEFGSGNFYGFIQYRQTIPNESCKKYFGVV